MPKSVYLIPSGPKNIDSLFPTIDFSQVKEYFIEAKNTDNVVVATTPLYQSNCCCPEEKIRIHFLNYVGTYDAINFRKPSIVHEDAADEFKKGLSYPLQKTDTGSERFNVNSNDTYTAKIYCNEGDMPFLQELADSPKMFMEWKGTEGQPDDYIPVVKIAGKFDKLKNVDEWRYEFVLEFKLSNDFSSLRN